MRYIFHLSMPVRDLATAKEFYLNVLGAKIGRETEDWLDVLLWGHQITLQRRPDEVLSRSDQGRRHFGVILPWLEWEQLAERWKAEGIEFAAPPEVFEKGTPEEQAKLHLRDPSNNVIEIKAYRDLAKVLGTEDAGYGYMHIQPRLGLDRVLFGMSQGQVRSIHGEPEEVSRNAEGEDVSVAWYYWSLGFSFHFDSDQDWRLGTIEVHVPSVLSGHAVVGMALHELYELLRSEAVPWTEHDFGTESQAYVYVPDWDMNFWIEVGVVSTVQWGVPFDDQDREIWPSPAGV